VASLSATQTRALAQIKFAGLVIYSYGEEEVDFAVLDLMPAASIRVNRRTVMKLIREGLIERDVDSEYDVDWRLSSLGQAVLRDHSAEVAAAGRQVNGILASAAVASVLKGLGDQSA
jgi:hypothetical protein